MTPQIISPDLAGLNNNNLQDTIDRLQKGRAWKDLSTIILVPAGDSVPTKVVASWLSMITPPNGKVFRMWALGHEVGAAYSMSIESIIAHPDLAKFKYLLTLEHDNSPPPDGLIRLLEDMEEHPEYACIGGLYYTKGMDINGGGTGVAQLWGDPKAADQPNFRPQVPIPNTVQEVVGTGMGFNLWRMDMLKDTRIQRPLFETKADSTGVGTQDLTFWSKARQFGYRCAVDTRIHVGHYDLRGDFGPPDTMY